MIIIVNYGMGNLGSVLNMFKKLNFEAKISSDLNEISKARKLLLPGVGSFDTAMNKINDLEMTSILNHKALVEKIPILGICLGMQLITKSSEEGILPGLGWIDAETFSFKNRIDNNFKIPHMGWNQVSILKNNLITKNLDSFTRFYFVHSYFVKVNNENDSLMKSQHGINFDSAIVRDNIFGAQFHPEKSHKYGMNFLKNFAEL